MNNGLTKENKIFILLSSIFITLLVVSNIIASKLIIVGDLIAPAAVLCYACTFIISDTLSEVWGKEKTTYIVRVGFIVSIISAIMIKIAIVFPSAPAPIWEKQKEFGLILGSNLRIVIASMVAYLVSQHHDVWAFNFWKSKTNGKYLWIRNNMSTLVSQIIDTVLFIVIAFYGTGAPILTMIISQYIIKLVIALADTPLVYLLVGFVNKILRQNKQNKSIISN